MDLRLLRYFHALAEQLNFGRAARALHITQPVLSRQIQRLESEIGARLFERNKRSVRLTAAGEVLRLQAPALLAKAEAVLRTTRKAARGQAGSISIASGQMTAYAVLPKVLELIREYLSETDLHVSHASTLGQISDLLHYKIDVGFVIPPFDDSGLRVQPLFDEPIVAAVPASHPLARKKTLHLAQLKDEPLVFPPSSELPSGFAALVEGYCRTAGFNPRIAHRAHPANTVLALVGAGFGSSLVVESMVQMKASNVAFVALAERLTVPISMAWREDEQCPLVLGFVELVRREFAHQEVGAKEGGRAAARAS